MTDTAKVVTCQRKTLTNFLKMQASFPKDYNAALRQAQEAVKSAIADGHLLIEVDLPTGGRLAGVSGDSEGQREMNE